MDRMEFKRVALSDIIIPTKDDGESDEMRFKGYGAMFGNVDGGGDVIEPGAFAKTLKAASKSGVYPAMLLQHGIGWTAEDLTPIGVWDKIEEDEKGLPVDGILAPTQRGKDVYTLLKMKPRPAISGLSIGYVPKKVTLGTKETEPRRRLHEVELIEISLVTNPMNGKARITGVKSLSDLTEREVERWLMQDAGLSRSEARVVINSGFKSLKAMQDAGSSELSLLAEALKKRDVF